MARLAILVAAAALSLGGCGGSPPPCMGVAGSSQLVQRAALFRLAVYGGGAGCDGSQIAAGAGAPIASGDFVPGETIRIDAPSGPGTVTLSAWGDVAATELLGTACRQVDLPAGSPLCLDLTLVAASDGGASGDAAADLGCAACDAGRICCDGVCVDPDSDPDHCGGCGTACSTVNATPECRSGRCSWSCSTGFGHCVSGNTGCETALDTVASCGGCQACDTVSSVGASCTDGACSYVACAPGHLDCNSAAPNLDGCECATPACCGSSCQTTHDNGVGRLFYDCQPKNTYDATQATSACAAFTGDASLCHVMPCGGGKYAVCSDGAADCVCWGYAGGGVSGRVADSGSPSCSCPGGGSPSWS
jgi:hypothetical protein